MVRITEQLVELAVHVSWCIDMHLFAHFFIPKSGFEQGAGGHSVQVFADQRIQRVHRKPFLRQKNLGSGLLLHIVQGFQVLLQQPFINQIGR
ncbi:hypothetical protein D3C81_1868280 [compost metagenome]